MLGTTPPAMLHHTVLDKYEKLKARQGKRIPGTAKKQLPMNLAPIEVEQAKRKEYLRQQMEGMYVYFCKVRYFIYVRGSSNSIPCMCCLQGLIFLH
jgi:hypothetical protein